MGFDRTLSFQICNTKAFPLQGSKRSHTGWTKETSKLSNALAILVHHNSMLFVDSKSDKDKPIHCAYFALLDRGRI